MVDSASKADVRTFCSRPLRVAQSEQSEQSEQRRRGGREDQLIVSTEAVTFRTHARAGHVGIHHRALQQRIYDDDSLLVDLRIDVLRFICSLQYRRQGFDRIIPLTWIRQRQGSQYQWEDL